MAQISNDFSGYALGQVPSDWKTIALNGGGYKVENVGGEIGNVLRYVGPGVSDDQGLEWDAVNVPEGDLLVKFRDQSTTTSDYTPAVLRVEATGDYSVGAAVLGDTTFRINRLFSYQPYATATIPQVRGSGWHYVRLNFSSSSRIAKAKIWPEGASEPSGWDIEVTASGVDNSAVPDLGIGVHVYRGVSGVLHEWAWLSLSDDPGVPADNLDAGAGGPSGATSDSSTGSDAWSALCAASTSTVSTASASDSLSVIASINTSIISAAQASDQSGESPAALVSLESAATGSDSIDALASAAAALSAGAAAGESWTVQAQVVTNLLNGAASSDQIARATENAINAAVTEGSAASAQFIAAIDTLAGTEDTASASDAFVAVVTMLAGFSSGAIASDSFGLNFGQIKAIESGAISADAWILAATLSAALSEVCTAQEIMTARVEVSTAVNFSAIASDTFAIVNKGIQYLVMGAITMRAALSQTVTIKP